MRCRACNRPIYFNDYPSNTDPDYCSVCIYASKDYLPDHIYQHESIQESDALSVDSVRGGYYFDYFDNGS